MFKPTTAILTGCLSLALVGASPASRPTTGPTTKPAPTMAELKQRAAQADDAVRAAEDACLHRLRGIPNYAAAVADRDAKEQRLADARNDPQSKLAASRDS